MKNSIALNAAAVFLLILIRSAGGVEVFSSGLDVPETISAIPTAFGGLDGFLVPDPAAQKVWQVPSAGGSPSSFADADLTAWDNRPGIERVLGGLFLPDTWGANAGQYATRDQAVSFRLPRMATRPCSPRFRSCRVRSGCGK